MQLSRPVILLVVSALVGAATVVASALWLRAHNATEIVQVVVASQTIEAGVKLKPEYLKLVDWPKSSLPSGTTNYIDHLVDRVTHSKIHVNEIVLDNMLLAKGVNGNLAAVIAPGMRAISIPVNDIAGVAGFVFPGNYVDVLLRSKDSSGQASSKVLLQRVLVLAADQDRSVTDESKGRVVKAVTLQVTPLDAEKIDLARSVGVLSLILRGQEDSTERATSLGVAQNEVSPRQATPPQPSSATSSESVEVIRGIKRSIGPH